MSGYFSHMARQSGLRFAEPRPSSAGTLIQGARPRSSKIAPVDVEEFVEVPSTPETNNPLSSKTDRAPKAISEIERMAVRERAEGAPLLNRPQPMVVPSEIHDRIREEVPIVRFSGDMSSKGEIQTVDSEPSRPVEERATVGEHSERVHELRTNESVPAVSSEQQQENKHFRKIAGIIDGSAMEHAEIQTVLLQEIQEWIAAGPVAPEKSGIMKEGHQGSSPRKQREVVQPSEPEPSVVRIGSTERVELRTHDQPMKAIPDIQEQVLDLSIGTISVVIEDDKRPIQLAPARRSESGQGNRASRPSPSRLSRHYI